MRLNWTGESGSTTGPGRQMLSCIDRRLEAVGCRHPGSAAMGLGYVGSMAYLLPERCFCWIGVFDGRTAVVAMSSVW